MDIASNIDEAKAKIKLARDIAYQSPELNMNNFHIDDVEKLNDAMVEVFNILDELDE